MERLIELMESRIRRNVYVRFGGEHLKTYHSNMERRWVLSLHNAELFPVVTIIIMEAFINKLRRLKGVRKMLICFTFHCDCIRLRIQFGTNSHIHTNNQHNSQ